MKWLSGKVPAAWTLMPTVLRNRNRPSLSTSMVYWESTRFAALSAVPLDQVAVPMRKASASNRLYCEIVGAASDLAQNVPLILIPSRRRQGTVLATGRDGIARGDAGDDFAAAVLPVEEEQLQHLSLA